MLKNTFLICNLLLFTIACNQKAEKTDTDTSIDKNGDSITAVDENAGYEMNAEFSSSENYGFFIPNGYDVLQKAEGDINNDGTSDMILVLKSQKEKADEMPEDELRQGNLAFLTWVEPLSGGITKMFLAMTKLQKRGL